VATATTSRHTLGVIVQMAINTIGVTRYSSNAVAAYPRKIHRQHRNYFRYTHHTIKSQIGLLNKSALCEFLNPRLCVTLGYFALNTVFLNQDSGNIGNLKLLALQLVPEQQRGVVERDYTGHIASAFTLHNHHIFASHRANFISRLKLHNHRNLVQIYKKFTILIKN
jgi:hypothetical protein